MGLHTSLVSHTSLVRSRGKAARLTARKKSELFFRIRLTEPGGHIVHGRQRKVLCACTVSGCVCACLRSEKSCSQCGRLSAVLDSQAWQESTIALASLCGGPLWALILAWCGPVLQSQVTSLLKGLAAPMEQITSHNKCAHNDMSHSLPFSLPQGLIRPDT